MVSSETAGALLAVFNRFIVVRTACWIRSPRVVKASDGCGRGQMNVLRLAGD